MAQADAPACDSVTPLLLRSAQAQGGYSAPNDALAIPLAVALAGGNLAGLLPCPFIPREAWHGRLYRFIGSFFYHRAHARERLYQPRAFTHVGGINREHFTQ